LQSESLIHHPVVAANAVGAISIEAKGADRAKAIIEGHDDHVLVHRKVTPVVQKQVCGLDIKVACKNIVK
jgi:hypothetical protein